MLVHKILNASEIGVIPPIVSDYLGRNPNLNSQISTDLSFEGLETLMNNRKFSKEQRQKLVEQLKHQYKEAKLDVFSSEVGKSIYSLENENTFTIVTGHQLSLFGGTLFMAYKILTAIKLSQELKSQYPEKNFVPILWLASEDHDFEEIKGTYWKGQTISWEKISEGQPVGVLDLQGIQVPLEQIISDLEKMGLEGEAIGNALKSSYLDSKNLGEATIKFYHFLFEKWGLVVLDPNCQVFKKELVSIIKQDLLTDEIYEAQLKSDKALEAKYKLQINARAANFFYLDQKLGRRLIKKSEGKYLLGDQVWINDAVELEKHIETYPERFSPNVNLRPVYQEIVLPNLAYIGGPAEIAYWLQLKPNFDSTGVPFPILVPRFFATILGSSIIEKIEKTGLPFTMFFGSESKLNEAYIDSVKPMDYHQISEEILEKYQILIDGVKNMDVSLGKELLQLKLKAKEELKKNTPDIKKAIESGEQNALDKLQKLRSRIYVNGILQERIETTLQYRALYGKDFFEKILTFINPMEPAMHLIKV